MIWSSEGVSKDEANARVELDSRQVDLAHGTRFVGMDSNINNKSTRSGTPVRSDGWSRDLLI